MARVLGTIPTTDAPQTGGRDLGAVSSPAPAQSLSDSLWSDLANRGSNIKTSLQSGQNPAVKGLDIVGQGAGFVGDAVGDVAKSAFNAIPGAPEAGKATAEAIAKTPIGQLGISALKAGGDMWNSFQAAHPTEAQVLGDVGNIASLIPIATGAKVGANLVKDVVGGVVKNTGTLLKSAGEKATGIGVGMTEPTKIALQTYQATKPTLLERVGGMIAEPATKPITEANTAVRLLSPGTEWQLGVSAKRVSGQLWDSTIAPALDASKNVNNMPSFVDNIRTRIIKETPDLDRRNILLKALTSFSEDYKNVSNFSDKKLQAYKEGWARFVPEKTYKGEPISAASKEVRSIAADEARSVLYKILPDGAAKQAYIDYGNLTSIKEAGIKSIDPLRSKGVSKQVWEAVMDKAVTPISTTLGKVLYKTGDGLEFIGNPGATKVRDIVTTAVTGVPTAAVNDLTSPSVPQSDASQP